MPAQRCHHASARCTFPPSALSFIRPVELDDEHDVDLELHALQTSMDASQSSFTTVKKKKKNSKIKVKNMPLVRI